MTVEPKPASVEIEAKYLVESVDRLDAVLTVVRRLGWEVQAEPVRRIVDTYVDTADGRLRGSGAACRHRRQNDRHYVTLKQRGAKVGAVHTREESEHELSEPPADAAAIRHGPLAAALAPMVGGEPLGQVLSLSTTRQPFVLRSTDGVAVELVMDDVRGAAPGSDRTCVFCEIELELKQGDQTAIGALTERLEQQLGLAPSDMNKLRRAAALLGLAPPA